jgi:methionine synthase I (cobalamin-dependent)
MLQGYDDPLVRPEDVVTIAKEFIEAGADWQLRAGTQCTRSTYPAARIRAGGRSCDEAADARTRGVPGR